MEDPRAIGTGRKQVNVGWDFASDAEWRFPYHAAWQDVNPPRRMDARPRRPKAGISACHTPVATSRRFVILSGR